MVSSTYLENPRNSGIRQRMRNIWESQGISLENYAKTWKFPVSHDQLQGQLILQLMIHTGLA